ncbi:MAG: hypothetical protein ACT4QC_10220 [Planctomycetaceae bacterium]
MTLIRPLTIAHRRWSAWIALAAITSFAVVESFADDAPATGTREVKAGELKLLAPAKWKENPEVRQPRVAEFQAPAAEGDSEAAVVVVFYFGPQGAGGVRENIGRWVDQFEREGRAAKFSVGEAPQGKYTLVDLTGTYNKSIGPPIQRKTKSMPGWRVINVLLETNSGPYYLKIDGPEKTVAATEASFRTMFGAKKDTEKELKSE